MMFYGARTPEHGAKVKSWVHFRVILCITPGVSLRGLGLQVLLAGRLAKKGGRVTMVRVEDCSSTAPLAVEP